MEEVPPAAAALLDLLSPGGGGSVLKEGYTKHRGQGVGKKRSKTTTPILQLRAKLDRLFGNGNTSRFRPSGEGLGSRERFFPWYHGKEPGRMEGGGRSSLAGC